jgi:hypothetical protein
MGWAENRIAGYQHGRPASWLERRMLEHANVVHFPLALASTAGFVYGLWTHDWLWIIASSALALLGHVYCWTWKGGGAPREPGIPHGETPAVKAG